MILCIPTLCNYDGVDALIRSAEAGRVKPSGYVVLDNGGGYTYARLHAAIGERRCPDIVGGELITPGRNLGVAASWNVFLEKWGAREPIVISNDDIILGKEAFYELDHFARNGFPRAGFGWALFMQSPECTEKVGCYDENFWPAYYEDLDYIIRMDRAGVPDVRLEGRIDIQHGGWTTTNAFGDADWLKDGRARNRSYLVAKWGTEGLEGDTFRTPFEQSPAPPGWSGRTRAQGLPLRWEVINELAQMIGATRYLELGLADGACIRKIEIREKWGVDQAEPPDAGVARVFTMTTDEFFAQHSDARDGLFDIVFVDADHSAEQVYRDVQNAIRVLTPGGVVVMHDCSPHSFDMQVVPYTSGAWTGDVWKTIVRLRWEGQHAVRVINSDYGIGLVIPGGTPHHLERRPYKPGVVSYPELVRNRRDLLGLLSGWEWQAWVESARPRPKQSLGLGEYYADKRLSSGLLEQGSVFEQWREEVERVFEAQGNAAPSLYEKNLADQVRPHMQKEAAARFGSVERDTLAVVFTTIPRADTTGVHLLKAFRELGVKVEYHEPCRRLSAGEELLFTGVAQAGAGSRSWEWAEPARIRAILCIDDDHGWPVPALAGTLTGPVPSYYWCIDCYRLDDQLYLGGTRRERLKCFDKVFYAQRNVARAHDAFWLPLAVDFDAYHYDTSQTKRNDFSFIGSPHHARTEFYRRLQEVFPQSFVGQAYGEAADQIYNESHLVVNYSVGGDLNMRMFEGQATSALLISNRIDNGEAELTPYVPLYDSFEECVALMHLFLKNAAIRTHLAQVQATQVMKHTYEVRAREFLKAIDFPLP